MSLYPPAPWQDKLDNTISQFFKYIASWTILTLTNFLLHIIAYSDVPQFGDRFEDKMGTNNFLVIGYSFNPMSKK